MARCDCYHQHGMKFLCYGTKNMEECSCGGDPTKCDFYPEKRKPTDLQKAIGLLETEYKKAKRLKFVRDPLAYALYMTWKTIDERRKDNDE